MPAELGADGGRMHASETPARLAVLCRISFAEREMLEHQVCDVLDPALSNHRRHALARTGESAKAIGFGCEVVGMRSVVRLREVPPPAAVLQRERRVNAPAGNGSRRRDAKRRAGGRGYGGFQDGRLRIEE